MFPAFVTKWYSFFSAFWGQVAQFFNSKGGPVFSCEWLAFFLTFAHHDHERRGCSNRRRRNGSCQPHDHCQYLCPPIRHRPSQSRRRPWRCVLQAEVTAQPPLRFADRRGGIFSLLNLQKFSVSSHICLFQKDLVK